MNNLFDEYLEAGTKGKEIVFDNCNNVFSTWIIDYYKNKGVKYFITNNYIILPIERFSDYFNVSAKYRVKRSGSSIKNVLVASLYQHIFLIERNLVLLVFDRCRWFSCNVIHYSIYIVHFINYSC